MSAKISHLALLPQGQPERQRRVVAMIEQADAEGFGSCSNEGECEAVCPKEIPISNIARMTRSTRARSSHPSSSSVSAANRPALDIPGPTRNFEAAKIPLLRDAGDPSSRGVLARLPRDSPSPSPSANPVGVTRKHTLKYPARPADV